MPFFCSNLKSKNQSVTLQVRILRTKESIGRKRASFSASASLTLEAALVLPMFLLAGVILMQPFRVMDVHRQVQAAAEHVSEQIGETAYLSKYGEADGAWNTAAACGYAELRMRDKLRNLPVRQVSLGRSSLLEDGETIDLVVDYEIPMPFTALGLKTVKQTVRSSRRAWVGEDGRSRNKEENESDDPIVYIGKNSTRYHVSSACHYLYNDLTAVPVEEVGNRRNKDGSRYTSCARCGEAAEGMVYIMPSGRHWHSSPSCPAISAYVTAVPRSEVEYLGICSYCSKRK